MFASLQIHGQILGRRALSGRSQGLAKIVAVALFTASLVGCGQKGPLFLPGPPPPLQSTTATSLPASAPAQAIPGAPIRYASTPK